MGLFDNPDQEDAIRKRAQEAQARYEASIGQKVPEEPGIEPDRVTETVVDTLSGAGPVRAVGGGIARYATDQVKKSANDRLRRMRESGIPEKAPTFSDAVSAGKAAPGGSNFSKFIREGEEAQSPSVVQKVQKPDTLVTPRFGTTDAVKQLQTERQSLNLNSPEGRDRLKQIDSMLKNRTYFSGT